MNRLVRLVRRRPTVFATRRLIAPTTLHIRHYVPQTPSLESLYAEYIEGLKRPDRATGLHSQTEPVSFEVFKQTLESHLNDGTMRDEVEVEQNEDHSTDFPENGRLDLSNHDVDDISFLDRYENLVEALEHLKATDPNFSETLENISDDLARALEPEKSSDPIFIQRLIKLNVENSPAAEVAWRVAQLVLSTTDKWELEQIEQKLATYNGPLSVLNAHVEWYLKNPKQIERAEEIATPVEEEESADFVGEADELYAKPPHDNNSYYYEDTPIDELVNHLRDRDVVYAIKKRMDRQDREDLFNLMDSIITPVFKEDMAIFNKIADIFNKYEDVNLVFRTQPRLPRIRRLEVFQRLLPELAEEEPSQEQENEEIANIVAEKKKEKETEEAERAVSRTEWPNLMTRDPLLDSRDVLEIPPTKENPYHNRIVIRNHHSIFTEALHADGFNFNDPNYEPTTSDDAEQSNQTQPMPSALSGINGLIMYTVVSRQARLQTSKGNKDRQVQFIIVGDGNGMVGLGTGKHKEMGTAHSKAVSDAVRNMDWVERFEDRTIWTEVRTKLGATTVVLRPRPVGFGLRCNPYIHRLLVAAGIKDVSAKVWGSRNKIQVLKATLRLLHAGHAPASMGDGVGGVGRKMHKGIGLQNKNQIERARGRRLVDLRV